MDEPKAELLRGTLDMLILKVVALGPSHGYAIAQRLRQISKDFFQIHQGSLYPALHRLEDRGWLQAEWKESKPGAKPNSTRSPRRAAAKWTPKSPNGNVSAMPSACSSALPGRSPNRELDLPSLSEITNRKVTRHRAAIPPRSSNRRFHSRRHAAR